MRGLLNFIFKLIVLAIVIFLLTAVGIVFYGLADSGQKADVALVAGHAEATPGAGHPRLDRVVQLYHQGDFPFVIVSASTPDSRAQSTEMATYLESRGLPPTAIIRDHNGETTQETAHDVAQIMRARQFESVMLITDYYHIARTKLALAREGVEPVEKAHVGTFQKEDVWNIGREVVALYDFLGTYYLLPEAKKVKEEAQVGADKAQVEAEKAKATLNKKLDSMPK